MQTHELLDRFELMYPRDTRLSDLRRAYIDRDMSSIFRLLPTVIRGSTDDLRKVMMENNLHSLFRLAEDEELRKLLLENNTYKLWPVLKRFKDTRFIDAFKNLQINNIEYDTDCFSRGQLESKLWLVQELQRQKIDLGTVFLCAGWYATLATMLFESKIKVDKIRSFDIDPTCANIAEVFNKPWVKEEWQFKACTQDIMEIQWDGHSYPVTRSDGSVCMLYDTPDTIINTSCEHIENFAEWYQNIPQGKLVVLQSNNYFEIKEHVNCVKDIKEFGNMARMTGPLFAGELELPKYTRFMLIGFK